MPRLATVLSIVLAAMTAACNCNSELVEASFHGTATSGTASQAVSGVDLVSPTRIAEYQPLRDFFIEGIAPGTSGATWRVVLTSYGFLGATVPTSLRRGDVLPLTGVPRVGDWALSSSAGPGATASFQSLDGSFVTASAQGTLTVIGTDPMRFRVDAVFVNQAGATRAINGEASFTTTKVDRECFT